MFKILLDDAESSQQVYLYAFVCMLLIGFLAFGNVIGGDFVADDAFYVVKNENIRSVFNPDIFLGNNKITISGTQFNLYRPFYIFVLAIEYAFFGLDPTGYHIINIFLHSINSFLLYSLTLKTINKKLLALLVALIFAIHPIHTETVSNITGLSELLSTFFMLLAFWCYCANEKAYLKYFVSLFLYLLAIMSKENGAILIGVIILFDVCNNWSNISKLKSKAFYYLGYFLTLLVYVSIKFSLRGKLTAQQKLLFNGPITERIYTMSLVFAKYLYLLVWPSKLIAFYDAFIIKPTSQLTLSVFLSLCLIFGLLISGFILLWYERIIAFAILFFFGSMVIVSNIFFDIGVIMAERFLYFPSISICLIFGAIFYWLINKTNTLKIVGLSLFIVMFSLSLMRIHTRNLDWLTEEAVTEAFIRDAPESPRVAIMKYEKAVGLFENNQINEAITLSKQIVNQYPNYAQAHYKLGIMLQSQGNQKEALESFRKAKDLRPNDAEIKLSYAISLLNNNLLNDAKSELEAFIKNYPNSAEAHNYLGVTYINLQLYAQAQKELEKALSINPNYKAPELNLIELYKITKPKQN